MLEEKKTRWFYIGSIQVLMIACMCMRDEEQKKAEIGVDFNVPDTITTN